MVDNPKNRRKYCVEGRKQSAELKLIRAWFESTIWASFGVMLISSSTFALDHHQQKHHVRKLDQGVYYPNAFYSRSYIQEFPLNPGDRPLFFRLNPFQHYGRYEQGCPIEPDLTDGTFDLEHFAYRYRLDFEPPEIPRPVYLSPCDDPRARRWEDLVPPPAPQGVGPIPTNSFPSQP